MTTEVFLTDAELDVVFFIERFATTIGRTPTKSEVNNRFTGLDEDFWESFDSNPKVLHSFEVRGIIYPSAEDVLSAEQMHAVAAMTDLVDRRSDEKKLRDLGISTRKWATWLQNDQFATYLRDRSEKLLENSVHEAHKGLIKGVRNGNVASIKTLYEITGRHDPTKEAQIDVRRVLHTFIEVIQRYVKDPVMMHQIAMDLSQVASAESLSTGLTNQMMSGAQMVQDRRQIVQSSSVPNLQAPKLLDDEDD